MTYPLSSIPYRVGKKRPAEAGRGKEGLVTRAVHITVGVPLAVGERGLAGLIGWLPLLLLLLLDGLCAPLGCVLPILAVKGQQAVTEAV